MIVEYPDRLDSFNLSLPRVGRNLSQAERRLGMDDIAYILAELEAKLGVDDSTDPDSIDYRVAQLERSELLEPTGSGNQFAGMNSGGTGFEWKQLVAGTNVTISHDGNSITISATGGAGGGISSLNGLTGATQTFAKTDDTNVTLAITSSGTSHTFALGWTGTLADGRIASAATWNAKESALTFTTPLTRSTNTIGLAGLTTVGTANQIPGTNAGATGWEYKTLSVGTAGTDFAIAHAANSITLNLPTASGSNRGALSAADWTTFNSKYGSGANASLSSVTITSSGITVQTNVTFNNVGAAHEVGFGAADENMGDDLTVRAGHASSVLGDDYAGGNLFLTGGNATGMTGANGGNVYIYGGTHVLAGTVGMIFLAHTGAAARGYVGIRTAPSASYALSVGGPINITSGTLTAATAIGLASGGTNASLTASNGGVVYSTATALVVLAGTATANKVLMSGASAAPVWSTPTFPNASATSGKMIQSDGTNWVASTPTWPTAASTAGQQVVANGTNFVAATRDVIAYISGANVTTTNLTATAVTGLSISIGANETWYFECWMKVGSSSAAGCKYAVDIPTSATIYAWCYGTVGSATAYTQEWISADATLTTTAFNTAGITTAAVGAIIIISGIVANGANAGSIQIQHAKVTSGTSTVYTGSYVRGRRLN